MDATHDPQLASWLASANVPGCDFPVQNLPHGVFRRAGTGEPLRGGIAIGDRVLDLEAALRRGLFAADVEDAARLAATAPLNDCMALPGSRRSALRAAVSRLLASDAARQEETRACLVPQSEVQHDLPARVGDFSDFYSSLHHATNVGALFRPDNPVLPNYRWLPVGYTGRTSSLRVSGADVVRPKGQLKDANEPAPRYAPCRRLDYEVELGIFAGPGNPLGVPVDIERAEDHLFGMCLLNDWSARDIQAWEYQPLGPFLAKSFCTSLSPWVVTMDALEPFRTGFSRPPADPDALPHLWHPGLAQRGSIDIRVRLSLQTRRMREAGTEPVALSTSRFTDSYWALAQLVAHQTSNGSNLRPGDLLGSGTLSGPLPDTLGCLLELSQGGRMPLHLPGGEQRTFLEDGDLVILSGWCEAPGRVRIGFGECRGLVRPAVGGGPSIVARDVM
jgi:fumarylacetoacetase